jgi:hypothetical protein
MAVLDLMRRVDWLGIDYDNDNNKPLILSEQEQIRDYIRKNPRLDVGNDYTYDNKTDKDEDGLNHAPQ